MTPIDSFGAEIFVDATNHETIGGDRPTVSDRGTTGASANTNAVPPARVEARSDRSGVHAGRAS